MELGSQGIGICKQAGEAFVKKGSLDSFWQETAENYYPERADFTVTRSVGEDIASKLYSSEPILFRRDFGNFLGAALRPKGRDWFLPRARSDRTNELTIVRGYLESRAKITRNLLYDRKSQFIRAMTVADHDYVTFGNSVSSCEEREDKSGFRFRTWHLKNCAWRENYNGEVDTMFRRFKVKVRDLNSRQKQGWSICPKVLEKLKDAPDSDVNCLHVLMPALDYDYTKKRMRYDFVSCYVDEDNKWLMSEKQVPEFVYMVSRWLTLDSSPYAFSPCVVASIPDARTLQVMTWSIVEAGEKAVEPPLIAMNEAILGGVDIRAGSTTWVDKSYDERTGEALRALDLGGNPQFGDMLRQAITGNISAAWYLNKLFLPQNGPQMTAEEIMARNDEWLRVVQPIMDPAEPERNGATLDLVISMAIRLGYWGPLDEMPPQLKGQHVDVTYDNPVEDARRMAKTNAYKATAGIIEIAKAHSPEVVANFNSNKAFRDAIAGIAPPDWLLDEDEAERAVEEAQEEATADKALGEAAAIAETQAKAIPAMQAAA
jgi:hypothetical protein